MTSDSKITREIVERFHIAFEQHRPEDLDDLIGDGCVLENTAPAPDGTLYEGREACLTFWKGVASSANLVFKAEEISAIDDRGIIRWQLCWSEHEADRVRGVNIMRVRDGKIVEGLGYVKGADVPIVNRRSPLIAIQDFAAACRRNRAPARGREAMMINKAGYTRIEATSGTVL
ncbi:nuclear transport factor 2 family protein [Brucella anthropi]|uniref:nuclear transport factor 2 family protein n=1 Tax=Brucella anthropi TaxID=529 RepID=UPI0009BB22BE|nr:nuclear transport factor 2 family protein [Brucella anthropi]